MGKTLILGGGLAGLSCAYHLKSDYILLEASDEPGGLARSVRQEGFVFDYTGHLLHLRNPYTLKLIPDLLGDNLVLNERRAWIYSNGACTRYPFQANTYGLPKKVVEACLRGFVEAQLAGKTAGVQPESFKSWVMRTFGSGFARYFFFPYNEKLWTVAPDVLTAEWVAPFVPKPSVQEVFDGAFNDQTKKFGYNTAFYYPRDGGIQVLASALAKPLKNLHLNCEAVAVDLVKKEVSLANGEKFTYESLVNTLPLPRFLDMAGYLPAEIAESRRQMRWNSVYSINLGVARPAVSDKHWIYFPEKKFPFYRVGFPMNFSDRMVPPGCSSMYIEIAHQPGRHLDEAGIMKKTIMGLQSCGILRPGDKILCDKILRIPVAYVIYDKYRTQAAGKALDWLKKREIFSIGRYGAWKYSYMEEAILEGKYAAEEIDKNL
jgi:protoporphyrinogen oxidase